MRQFSDRATVYVGDDARPPTIAFPLVDSEPGAAAGLSELIWFGHEPHKAGVKGAQQVIAGQSVTLTVNYQPYSRRKAGENPLPVAFVAILEDRVVPLNGQPVFYGSVLPHRLSYLPITIRVPDAPGLYQLFVQPFPHPYVDAREAARTRRDLYAISSQRFILDAR